MLAPYTCCEVSLHPSRFTTEALDRVLDRWTSNPVRCDRSLYDCYNAVYDECLMRASTRQPPF